MVGSELLFGKVTIILLLLQKFSLARDIPNLQVIVEHLC